MRGLHRDRLPGADQPPGQCEHNNLQSRTSCFAVVVVVVGVADVVVVVVVGHRVWRGYPTRIQRIAVE